MAQPPHLLPVEPLASLRSRRSAKWQTYPPDVIPLTVAEMDFAGLRRGWQIDAGAVTAVTDVGVGVVAAPKPAHDRETVVLDTPALARHHPGLAAPL